MSNYFFNFNTLNINELIFNDKNKSGFIVLIPIIGLPLYCI